MNLSRLLDARAAAGRPVTVGVIDTEFEDYRTPVKTREGTTTINREVLRGVKPRD